MIEACAERNAKGACEGGIELQLVLVGPACAETLSGAPGCLELVGTQMGSSAPPPESIRGLCEGSGRYLHEPIRTRWRSTSP